MASPLQSFRLPPALAARIDAYQGNAALRSRGSAIVALIELGLATVEPKPKAKRTSSAPTDPPARQVSDDAPAWMRRGFTSGKWR